MIFTFEILSQNNKKVTMQLTPAMQQYMDIKQQYSDCILFFRIGDFYETFWDDANICSKVLDLVLTSKNKESENPIPLAGIPYHSADKYIPKLLHHGYKVAIAEQTTEPTPGKIVERKVVSVITPGTYIQEQSKRFSYMMAITFSPHKSGYNYHIARGDFTLGEYRTKSFAQIEDMQKFILMIKPLEIIFDVNFEEKDTITNHIHKYISCLVSVHDIPPNPEHFITHSCSIQSISSFGRALEDGRLGSLSLLLHYIFHTQKHTLNNILRISFHHQEQLMLMDDITIKNLELFSSSYEGSEKYSLFGVLDSTKTASGSRLLRHILGNPLTDFSQLQRRLNHLGRYTKLLNTTPPLWDFHHNQYLLGQTSDIKKLLTLLSYKKLSPHVFVKLRATLRLFFLNFESTLLGELFTLGLTQETAEHIQKFYLFLEQLLKSDEEIGEQIDFIKDGYDTQVDELRKVAYHSDELLLAYQQELVKTTGVSNIKIKFVINQGYFLEITNKDIQDFEDKLSLFADKEIKYRLIRRNTLKGGQRYTSEYLEELQHDILKAKDQLAGLEFGLLEETKQKLLDAAHDFFVFADYIAWLDVFFSHALFAHQHNYTMPIFHDLPTIMIEGGRHPVIETYLPKDQSFIPNDLHLGSKTQETPDNIHIITGPNMGGKSTYLRQNAVIVLLAHCGLFVPAKTCRLPLIDALFARVGSGDVIAKNQSTFMTEMIEVANILHNATPQSFIIFDELGRGTSTYDGLALTQAILEYVATKITAKTMIATHYHELIKLEENLPGIKNFSVSVYETDKEVVFMKKIVAGGADKSYGIDVAKLAGIPQPILARAKELLLHLEKTKNPHIQTSSFDFSRFDVKDPRFEKIKSLLATYNINELTPLQALQILAKIKDDLTQ